MKNKVTGQFLNKLLISFIYIWIKYAGTKLMFGPDYNSNSRKGKSKRDVQLKK